MLIYQRSKHNLWYNKGTDGDTKSPDTAMNCSRHEQQLQRSVKMSEDKRKVRVLDDVKDGDAIIVNGKAFIYYKGEFIEGVKVAEKIALVLEGVTLRISEAMNNILNSLGDEWYE